MTGQGDRAPLYDMLYLENYVKLLCRYILTVLVKKLNELKVKKLNELLKNKSKRKGSSIDLRPEGLKKWIVLVILIHVQNQHI